jgi:hypothetical protein
MIGDHYEVKVDDEWVPVPNDKLTTWSRLTVALRLRPATGWP